MGTFRYVVKMSEGGKGKGRQWTNTFHINAGATVADADVKTASDSLVAAIRQALVADARIDQVTVKDPSNDGGGYDPAKVKVIPYDEAGSKVTQGSALEVKEVVVRLRGECGTGRSGHNAIRMLLLDTEAKAGTDGEPTAPGTPSGVADMVTALNAMIAGGTDFRKYGKRKSGATTDISITNWTYDGIGARSSHSRHRKRGGSTSPSGWVQSAKNILDDVLRLTGSYQLAKAGSAALKALPVSEAVAAIETGANAALEVLPELALL